MGYGGYGEAPAKSLKSLDRKLHGSYGKGECKSLKTLYGSYGSLPLTKVNARRFAAAAFVRR
jgi:hypothetical protein